MWIGLLISAAAIAVGVIIGVHKAKNIRALQKDGTIIRRDMNYAEKGEQFTSRIGSVPALRDEILKAKFPCDMKGDLAGAVDFTAKSFAARLNLVAFDEPSGIAVYRFGFTRWKKDGYMYVDDISMNALMTAVEKTFLALDPNTGVQSYDVNFKTKHSIF